MRNTSDQVLRKFRNRSICWPGSIENQLFLSVQSVHELIAPAHAWSRRFKLEALSNERPDWVLHDQQPVEAQRQIIYS